MPNPDFSEKNNEGFGGLLIVIFVLMNVAFLVLAIFSESFRESLYTGDNSASCRYEQSCDK